MGGNFSAVATRFTYGGRDLRRKLAEPGVGMAGAYLLSIVATGVDGMVTKYRHRDLCWKLNITPYTVILQFEDALRKTQKLPVHMIPSWDKPDAEPQPESTPRPKRKLKQPQKPAITPSQVPTKDDDDDDVEMAEVGGPSVAGSTRKSGPQQPKSNRGKAGLKRRPQESPQTQRSSKRPRGTTESAESAGVVESDQPIARVELGEHTFDEDTPIDLSLVPALKDKVSFVDLRYLFSDCSARFASGATGEIVVRLACRSGTGMESR